MKQWWTHHAGHLPEITDIEKQQIEDITGRTPLFLRALLGLDRDGDVVSGLLNSRDLLNVAYQVEKFALNEKLKSLPMDWSEQV